MAATEAERCKLAVDKLRDLGYPAAVSVSGRAVEVSADAAERLIRISRPRFRLPVVREGDGNDA